jgi:hypothetical protein
MSVFSRALSRPGQAFLGSKLAIVVVLAAAIVGTTTVGFAGAITTGLIYACVNNSSGTIKIVSATTSCASNEILLVWNGEGSQGPTGATGPEGPTGPTGPAGSFTGTFTSPNGQCSISVTDTGIVLGGPSCPLQIDASAANLRSATTTRLESGTNTLIQSGGNTSVSSGATTSVASGGPTAITGISVSLGGGCVPVARVADFVNIDGPVGIISTGSAIVTAC